MHTLEIFKTWNWTMIFGILIFNMHRIYKVAAELALQHDGKASFAATNKNVAAEFTLPIGDKGKASFAATNNIKNN